MAVETSELDLILLQKRAAAVSHYVNRHKSYDPLRARDGVPNDLYLMEQKTQRNSRPPTIISYATVAEIEDALQEIESNTFGKLAHV